ncbi:MAG: hypothetical protein ACSHXI_18540 [Hoeflea sp.]|uniref:hypothetical protein n=1 Tax=Hoeflea sp. TaxID=1940281 RepID=UPI003EF456C7
MPGLPGRAHAKSQCVACPCTTRGAVEIARIPPNALSDDEFLNFSWQYPEGAYPGENEYLSLRPKEYRSPDPDIHVEDDGYAITMTSDLTAPFVAVDHGSSVFGQTLASPVCQASRRWRTADASAADCMVTPKSEICSS